MVQFVEFTKRNDNLVITLLPEGRQMIEAARDEGINISSDSFLHDLCEHPLCNGWEEIGPEEIGALTAAPIFSDEAQRDEMGHLTAIGRVYWFPNYQVECPVETLLERGEVVSQGCS